jgi:hypothetical protein
VNLVDSTLHQLRQFGVRGLCVCVCLAGFVAAVRFVRIMVIRDELLEKRPISLSCSGIGMENRRDGTRVGSIGVPSVKQSLVCVARFFLFL